MNRRGTGFVIESLEVLEEFKSLCSMNWNELMSVENQVDVVRELTVRGFPKRSADAGLSSQRPVASL